MWILNFLPDWIFHLILLSGLAGLAASFVLKFVPFITQYRIPIQIAAIILTTLGVWYEGGIAKDKEYRERIAELEAKVVVAEAKSREVNVVIQEKVVEKIRVVKENVYINREIIKEVAGAQLDASCTLPKSTISLHDSASRNEVASGTSSTDGSPSGIEASALLDTVVQNYGAYYQCQEKLIGWQNWYFEQKKIFETVK